MAETAELKAGRELDEAIGREVMGWTLVGVLWRDASGRAIHTVSIDYDDSDGEFPAFLPSTDIAAAWEVVEYMEQTHWPHIKKPASGQGDLEHWQVMFHLKDGELTSGKGVDRSLPLAICLAALKTVRQHKGA